MQGNVYDAVIMMAQQRLPLRQFTRFIAYRTLRTWVRTVLRHLGPKCLRHLWWSNSFLTNIKLNYLVTCIGLRLVV